MLLMRETQPHKQGKKNSGELKHGDPMIAHTLFVRAHERVAVMSLRVAAIRMCCGVFPARRAKGVIKI